MERIEPVSAEAISATQVWSVADFCARHRLGCEEEARLTALFGQFATTCELVHNVSRKPKFR